MWRVCLSFVAVVEKFWKQLPMVAYLSRTPSWSVFSFKLFVVFGVARSAVTDSTSIRPRRERVQATAERSFLLGRSSPVACSSRRSRDDRAGLLFRVCVRPLQPAWRRSFQIGCPGLSPSHAMPKISDIDCSDPQTARRVLLKYPETTEGSTGAAQASPGDAEW